MNGELEWKSAACTNDTCVQVARDGDEFLIRNPKEPDLGPLRFTEAEWDAFVQGAKAGEFRG